MKNSSRLLLGSLIAGTALAAALALHASSGNTPAGTGVETLRSRPLAGFILGRAIHQLDLAADQRAQAKAVIRKYQPEIAPAVDQMLAARQTLRDAIRTVPYNAVAVEAAADQVQRAQKQVILDTAKMRSDLRLVLTPKQLDQLDRWEVMIDDRIAEARSAFADWLAKS